MHLCMHVRIYIIFLFQVKNLRKKIVEEMGKISEDEFSAMLAMTKKYIVDEHAELVQVDRYDIGVYARNLKRLYAIYDLFYL